MKIKKDKRVMASQKKITIIVVLIFNTITDCRTNPVFLALERIKVKPQSSTESSAAESR